MDVSDIVEYNVRILNASNLGNSFFYLSKTDPTVGFAFDATIPAGHTYPETSHVTSGEHLTTPIERFGRWWTLPFFSFCELFATRRKSWIFH